MNTADDSKGTYEGPLAGLRVLEFCQVAAGPFSGLLLADMGADVIKIEAKSGDSMRQWPPFNKGYSENFASLNRNKRSIALDLKDPGDRRDALELARQSDVILENNRPGVMKRLGLDYESLSAEMPALVYCSISAFGQSGPRAEQGGFDLTIQGIAGLMSVTGEEGRPPVKCGVPISDFSAGLYGAFSALAMVFEARRTGQGAHVDIPMMGATLGISALQTSEYFGRNENPKRLGSAHPRNAPYQAFTANDGHFVLAAGNDKLWKNVCDVMNRSELLDDPRFKKQVDRAMNQLALKELLEEEFQKNTAAAWIELFSSVGVPCEPINDISSALADPQVEYSGWVQEMELPGGGNTKTFGSPVGILNRPDRNLRRPPDLDEHAEEIREELRQSKNHPSSVKTAFVVQDDDVSFEKDKRKP